MRQRLLAYLTVLFTLLFPLFGVVWARSYISEDTIYRIGRGRAMMLTCVRGELALWTGPARETGPVRYAHESDDSGMGMTAQETLAGVVRGSSRGGWVLGFGAVETYAFAPRERGPVRCAAVPLWFLTLFAAAWPARAVMRHVRRNQAAVDAERARCRRCGEPLADGETRCHTCSFPAFIHRGVVA